MTSRSPASRDSLWQRTRRRLATLRDDMALRRRIRPHGDARSFARAHLERTGRCWCFVLGVNDSGTTLLTDLLRRHPEVDSLPAEGQHLTRALPHPRRLGVSRTWTRRLDVFRWDEEAPDECVEAIVFDWLRQFALGSGVLLEKSPPNTVRARWLQRHFAPARFVAIVRNPFAVAEGIHRREGVDLATAARHWRVANEILLEDWERLERKVLLKYEDLCREPASALEPVRGLLGLREPFPTPLRGASETRRVAAGIEDQNAASIARLAPDEIAAIARIVAPVSERLGYAVPR